RDQRSSRAPQLIEITWGAESRLATSAYAVSLAEFSSPVIATLAPGGTAVRITFTSKACSPPNLAMLPSNPDDGVNPDVRRPAANRLNHVIVPRQDIPGLRERMARPVRNLLGCKGQIWRREQPRRHQDNDLTAHKRLAVERSPWLQGTTHGSQCARSFGT